MASDMTCASTAAVVATVAALAFAGTGVEMTSNAAGGMTASVGTLGLHLTGMGSSSIGGLTCEVGRPQVVVPMSSSAPGSMTMGSTLQTLIAQTLPNISAWITGNTSRAAMRRRSFAGLTVYDAAREVYNLWSIEITDPRSLTFARERVLQYINQTVQTIHSRAHLLDFFNLKEYTVTVVGATNSIALSDAIQVVRGPVKLSSDNSPLRQLASRGEIDDFTAYYYGETAAPSTPRAYYIDSRNQTTADNVLLTLYVAPTPADDTDIKFEAAVEPPRYDEGDIQAATALQIPNKFAESLFWPILRHFGAADVMYSGKADQRQDIESKYQAAMQALGLYNPPPAELLRPKKKASTET